MIKHGIILLMVVLVVLLATVRVEPCEPEIYYVYLPLVTIYDEGAILCEWFPDWCWVGYTGTSE